MSEISFRHYAEATGVNTQIKALAKEIAGKSSIATTPEQKNCVDYANKVLNGENNDFVIAITANRLNQCKSIFSK